MGSPCTLLLLASSSVSSSGLDPSLLVFLGCLDRACSLYLSPPPLFSPSVFFLPIWCVFLFWWLCLHPVSVLFVSLTTETVSQEGHPKQKG